MRMEEQKEILGQNEQGLNGLKKELWDTCAYVTECKMFWIDQRVGYRMDWIKSGD